MKHQSFPAAAYNAQIAALTEQLNHLKTKKDRISWMRFISILLLIADIWYLHNISLLLTTLIGLVLAVIFTRMVIHAANTATAIEHTKKRISINQQEIEIAGGDYTTLPDGAAFLHPTHPYANDLDIFGKASLYQYINRTQSQQGNNELAGLLLQPSSLATVRDRQAAVTELVSQSNWRQELQAYGMQQPISVATENKVADWVQQQNGFSAHPGWRIVRFLYPATTLAIVVLFAADVMTTGWFSAAYIIALGISGFVKKLVFPQYVGLNKIVPEIDVLFNAARCIESNTFNSLYLQQLQQQFTSNNVHASIAIKQLKNILDKFDASLNLVLAMVLNPLLLWDLQLIFRLEKWRSSNNLTSINWFGALGAMEAVSSIATLQYNHPHWVFPVFDTSEHGTFSTTGMGHPLIPEPSMVYNDFTTRGTPQVALITGSNMAGKSTFLRCTGVNMVLAMMGAPVCARQLALSPMRIISSMRVADNLAESTSTFYAELKKLKSIIESVNGHEKVFVLLDEILRGTNSLDRHTGSKALIKQLIQQKAVAMLATHDVELAQLQDAYPQSIHNYHFDAQIEKEELFFDYKLKEGVCKSINASLLMKKIGIEL